MYARLTALVVLLCGILQADVGWARDWLVERVSGTAWSINGADQRTELKVGMSVDEGLTIATAKNGRVRLSAENNVMTLGPGSVAAVKPKSFFSSKTEVQQQVGSIEFDIEKRNSPHFTVQTPFMAAVVKGTAFTISVAKSDTRISVNRGLVQVQDLRSGETAGVGAGQRASVSTTNAGLQTAGPQAPAPSPGKPSAPSVAPIGQTLDSFRTTQATERARASADVAGHANAASGIDTSTRSFGFAGATSASGDRSSSANASSGFGGFGGGLNGEGSDRAAAEANSGVNPEAAATNANGRSTRGDSETGTPNSTTAGTTSGSDVTGRGKGDPAPDNSGRGRNNEGSVNPGTGPAGPGIGSNGRGPVGGDPGRGPSEPGTGPGGTGHGPDGTGPAGDGLGRGPDGKGPAGDNPGRGPDGPGSSPNGQGRGPDGKGTDGDKPGNDKGGPGPDGNGRGPDNKGPAADKPGNQPDHKGSDRDLVGVGKDLVGVGRDLVGVGRDLLGGVSRRGNESNSEGGGGFSIGTK